MYFSLFPSSELHVGVLVDGRDLCVSESEGRKQDTATLRVIVVSHPVSRFSLYVS